MSDPPRILDQGGVDPRTALKRALLRSAQQDTPPPSAKRALVDALGVGDGALRVGGPASGVRRSTQRPKPPLFLSILQPADVSQRRFGTGAAVSGAAHAALLAVLVYGSTRPPGRMLEEPEVTVQLSAPRVRPSRGRIPPRVEATPSADETTAGEPRNASGRTATQATPDPLRATPAVSEPAATPPSAPASTIPDLDGSMAQDVEAESPLLPATPWASVLPFGEGMTRPRRISGPEPVYPRAAREAKVEGTMLARCVITTTGTLERCQILKSLPFLDQPVLEALARQRYTPVTFHGRPVDVAYVIPLKFELP